MSSAAGKEWTGEDIATVITAVVEGAKSKGEQTSKSHRVLGGKIAKARLGEWQGGPVRLGFDVVCYQRETDKELWRVVIEGRNKRVKVYPDGRAERFDREGNFPKVQPIPEVLRLAPSKDQAKIEAAVSVFKRYATESIGFSVLAHYLNALGWRNGCGGYFHHPHIEEMLSDPIYLGYYTWNKWHFGKFHRYTDGQTVPELNYGEKGSRNDKADWVQSRRLFDPLVDRETWDAVQRKLAGRTKRTNAPRSAAQYLAGLVYCGNCGCRMVTGSLRKTTKNARKDGHTGERYEYFCGTYFKAVREKRRKECKCLRNGVFQDTLEEYLARYLEETGKRLELLMKAPENGNHLTERLEGQEDDTWQAFADGLTRLCEYLAQHRPDEYSALLEEESARRQQEQREREANGYQPSTPGALACVVQKVIAEGGAPGQDNRPTPSLPPSDFVRQCVATYRSVFDSSGLATEVERLEAEHTALMHRYADLPTPRAKEKAKAELAALEDRIAELESHQQNAADVIEGHYRQMTDLQEAIREARLAMKSDNDAQALRRRAEALRAIVQRIECTFTATGQTGGGWGKKNARLVKVTIYPVVGDPAEFSYSSKGTIMYSSAHSFIKRTWVGVMR